ncbi:MAG: hypothetical protein KGL39_06990 [Patescibacteria group bacterium]|nr:hypothetical protein [Patescibacteria group bacterium]
MTGIRIQGFMGQVPRMSLRLLDPSQAQVSDDAYLFNREIRAWRGYTVVATPFNGVNTQAFYRYINSSVTYWLDWATLVRVARVPVTGDTKNRIFWTGDGAPKKAGNDIIAASGQPPFWNMGVLNPTAAPTAAKASGPSSGTQRAVSYVITNVTAWGEESGPSPAVVVTLFDGDTITVTRGAQTPAAAYNIVAWNVYRTITGASGVATYYYVGQQATFATTTFSDAVTDANLVKQGGFPSVNQATFVEPPTDLDGLTMMPNGMLAGFSPSLKQVCFSEPYFPHAWPTNYRRGLVDAPVACGAADNMLVVATTGKPQTFIGNDPSLMAGSTLAALQICTSARSLAESPFGVVWATPDGIFMMGLGATPQFISRNLYDKRAWQAHQPGGVFATIYDGRYYGFAPGEARVLVLDPQEPEQELTHLTVSPSALFSDFNADGLYMALNGKIIKWDTDVFSYRQYDWRSKIFTEDRPTNKSAGRVLFTVPPFAGVTYVDFPTYNAARNNVLANNQGMFSLSYAGAAFGARAFGRNAFGADDFIDVPPDIGTGITLKVYGDGVLRATVQIMDQNPVRLPSGYLAMQWELEVLGKVNVREIAVVNAMDEFRAVA